MRYKTLLWLEYAAVRTNGQLDIVDGLVMWQPLPEVNARKKPIDPDAIREAYENGWAKKVKGLNYLTVEGLHAYRLECRARRQKHRPKGDDFESRRANKEIDKQQGEGLISQLGGIGWTCEVCDGNAILVEWTGVFSTGKHLTFKGGQKTGYAYCKICLMHCQSKPQMALMGVFTQGKWWRQNRAKLKEEGAHEIDFSVKRRK